MAQTVKVLFVCLGNICRSPTAQGVFENEVREAGLSDRIEIDSAGTGHWHIGKSPDGRATDAASQRGIDISGQVARSIRPEDFQEFDLILAMDRDNLSAVQQMAPVDSRASVELFLDYAHNHQDTDEVPDPYFGGAKGFHRVLELVEDASHGLLAHLRERIGA